MRPIGLLLSEDEHHLDHLAPLCSLAGIPLATDSPAIAKLCKLFYPHTPILVQPTSELPPYLLKNFDRIISSIAKPIISLFLFPHEDLMGKKMETVWCPHGYSDKGKTIPFWKGLNDEQSLLYYGSNMLNTLKANLNNLKSKQLGLIGNYRQTYFEKHALFYKEKISSSLDFVNKESPTLLYAPTWNDSENASSVDTALPIIIETLPPHLNLMIKLHPNTLKTGSDDLLALIEKSKEKPNLIYIDHIPTIWPLLDLADIFIGDMSSIGYDFLMLNKPMIFLPHQQCKLTLTSPLAKCGHVVETSQQPALFQDFDKKIQISQEQNQAKQRLRKKVFSQKVIHGYNI